MKCRLIVAGMVLAVFALSSCATQRRAKCNCPTWRSELQPSVNDPAAAEYTLA